MERPTEPARPELSIIVPCYNEERRLPASLDRLREYLDGQPYVSEVLVVDDGSSDGTVAYAEQIAAVDPRVRVLGYGENRGKGAAVAWGAVRARGTRVLFTDADLSTPIEDLEKLLPFLDAGYDVVIASRALRESQLKVHQPWWRERAGRIMNGLIRVLAALPFSDTQCGFKLFSGQAAADIFPNLTVRRWMFDVEALVVAGKLGYRTREVPVTWENRDDSRVKLSHTPSIFAELFHIRSYWLLRQPERRRSDEAEMAVQRSATP